VGPQEVPDQINLLKPQLLESVLHLREPEMLGR
jgi:hypothetical protein